MDIANPESPCMLDLFCGVGGWSKPFSERGWNCVGVDLCDFSKKYPFDFVQQDVLELPLCWINKFDAICMSPPCEEFARAELPWHGQSRNPKKWAIDLLQWSINLCDRPRRIVECSKFSARYISGNLYGSYVLWGDVPRDTPRISGMKKGSGLRPDLRAEIPKELSNFIAEYFTQSYCEDKNIT